MPIPVLLSVDFRDFTLSLFSGLFNYNHSTIVLLRVIVWVSSKERLVSKYR